VRYRFRIFGADLARPGSQASRPEPHSCGGLVPGRRPSLDPSLRVVSTQMGVIAPGLLLASTQNQQVAQVSGREGNAYYPVLEKAGMGDVALHVGYNCTQSIWSRWSTRPAPG
jgi:hypothetical protein